MMKLNIKLDNNFKMITNMTLIILSILIIAPLLLLGSSNKTFNPFHINDENVIKKSFEISFPKDGKVKLYRKEEGKVHEIDLEEYITGVVASEMPSSFDKEALKAQAVAARTFYMNKRNNPDKDSKAHGAEICDTTDCQVYMSKEERFESWNKKQAEDYWNKIKEAVEETKGQVLTYEGQVLEYPQFFAVSSGRTEDAKDVFSSSVPYLKSEESKGEEIAPKFKTSVDIPINEFINKINNRYPNINITKNNLQSIVKIKTYTEGGSVKEIEIGQESMKGTQFRQLFNLNSTNFTLSYGENVVTVSCIGYGHGVGMSQWGANVMAKNGSKYDEILKHYYSGVNIEKINYN